MLFYVKGTGGYLRRYGIITQRRKHESYPQKRRPVLRRLETHPILDLGGRTLAPMAERRQGEVLVLEGIEARQFPADVRRKGGGVERMLLRRQLDLAHDERAVRAAIDVHLPDEAFPRSGKMVAVLLDDVPFAFMRDEPLGQLDAHGHGVRFEIALGLYLEDGADAVVDADAHHGIIEG